MSQELVISSNPIETTVAVVEDDRLVEIYVEHHARKALSGGIYKGRVTRVLPGMQSAFVNLGLQRDAFLYVTDVLDASEGMEDDLDAGPIEAEPIQPLSSGPEASDEESTQAEGGSRGSSDQAQPSVPEHFAESGSTKPSRRRGRRRRRPGRGEGSDDVHLAPKSGDSLTSASQDQEPAERLGDEVETPISVLPGESIAKYRESPPPDGPEGKQADAASQRGEAPPPSDGSASDVGSAEQDDRPPQREASVSGPPTIVELRLGLIDWIKRKVDSSAATPAKEATAKPDSEPRRRRRGPRRGASRAQTAQRAAGRAGSGASTETAKKRPGRRQASGKRSQDGRPRGRARSDGSKGAAMPPRDRQPGPEANIKDLLKARQELIVQVTKEPVGTKGARITSHVSLPGRYMVYMTTAKHNGVARKIQPESERTRLRTIVDKHSKDKAGGFVVRSAARGVSEEVLVADMDFLHKLWAGLQEKAQKRKAPAKLHSDLDIVERVLRDNLGQSYKKVWVDSEDEFERVMRFVERFHPEMTERVKLYTRAQPIHDSFGISKDLERALKPKVWLKSGGYIVIDQTEALVAIDVNTGRYVGKSNRLEDTVLKTNLEAAEEIARQLRLRDLGGIIVIDFIDMDDRKNRQAVQQVLQDALKKMRSPTRLLPFNEFGLVVITRKAVRQSLERALCTPCAACSGAGTVKSSATVLSEIFSAANRIAANSKKGEGKRSGDLTLRVHPEIAKSFRQKSNSHLDELEGSVGRSILVRGDSSIHPGNFTLE